MGWGRRWWSCRLLVRGNAAAAEAAGTAADTAGTVRMAASMAVREAREYSLSECCMKEMRLIGGEFWGGGSDGWGVGEMVRVPGG